MRADDPEEELAFDFTIPTVAIDPGALTSVKVGVRPTHLNVIGQVQAHPFSVRLSPRSDATLPSITGTFRQRPIIPGFLPAAAAVVIALSIAGYATWAAFLKAGPPNPAAQIGSPSPASGGAVGSPSGPRTTPSPSAPHPTQPKSAPPTTAPPTSAPPNQPPIVSGAVIVRGPQQSGPSQAFFYGELCKDQDPWINATASDPENQLARVTVYYDVFPGAGALAGGASYVGHLDMHPVVGVATTWEVQLDDPNVPAYSGNGWKVAWWVIATDGGGLDSAQY